MAIPVEELQIPVPWGHIAAKAWGSQNDEPILAIHGFLDNAASFDQLISFITPGYYIVCVDLPGHGLSSHYPEGVQLTYLGYVCDLKRVFNYFAWSKCIILGHSIGSNICLYFSAIFSELVNKLILLDLFVAHLIPETHFVSDRCSYYIGKLLSLENSLAKPEIYSYEEALSKFYKNRYYYLSEKPASVVLKRSFNKTIHGYTFTNDKRIQFLKYPIITKDFHYGLIRGIKCQTCVIFSSGFQQFFDIPDTNNTIEILKTSLVNNLKLNKIEGNHYVHMNQPQRVAEVVNTFLQPTFSRL